MRCPRCGGAVMRLRRWDDASCVNCGHVVQEAPGAVAEREAEALLDAMAYPGEHAEKRRREVGR